MPFEQPAPSRAMGIRVDARLEVGRGAMNVRAPQRVRRDRTRIMGAVGHRVSSGPDDSGVLTLSFQSVDREIEVFGACAALLCRRNHQVNRLRAPRRGRLASRSSRPAALARRTPPDEAWTLPAYERYEDEVDPIGVADVAVRMDDPRHPALVTDERDVE